MSSLSPHTVPLLKRLLVWNDAEPHSAAENMATDEALLRSNPSAPVLRFYRWATPSFTFGYFQSWSEIHPLIPTDAELIRRWTGGGLVDHRKDLTYSLIVPSTDPLWKVRPNETYRLIHSALKDTLAKYGINAALARETVETAPGQCFQGYVQWDVLSGGRKISGAAQRRNRSGFLHQGSLLMPEDKPEFITLFPASLAESVEPFHESHAPGLPALARRLADTRYATERWQKRS